MTCLTHRESNHNLGVLSIGFKLQPVLASTGSVISHGYPYAFGTNLLYIKYSEIRVCPKFCPPPGFEPCMAP